MIGTKSYRIETRDPDTGYWELCQRITPSYQYETVTKVNKFLWWERKHTERIITNQDEEETEARRQAIRRARYLRSYGEDVRVYSENEDRWRGVSFDFSLKIWENGKWMD